jgi:hypothetical protein
MAVRHPHTPWRARSCSSASLILMNPAQAVAQLRAGAKSCVRTKAPPRGSVTSALRLDRSRRALTDLCRISRGDEYFLGGQLPGNARPAVIRAIVERHP